MPIKQIEKNLRHYYLGKPVPKQYQDKYGKTYDKKDIKKLAFAVEKSVKK